MRFKSFKTFTEGKELIFMNENVQAAKAFMKKFYAKRLNKSPEEMTPEEIKKSLEDRSYKQVLELTEKNPGYAYSFLRFAIQQGTPIKTSGNDPTQIRDLTRLLEWLNKRKDLIARLPRTIDEYSSSISIQNVSGFEKLTDDIRTLERNISSKWLVDNLPVKPRNEFRNLSPEEQQKFYNLAVSLEQLDEGDDKKTITRRLLDKIKALSEYTIKEITDYITEYIGGYQNMDMDKKIADIESLRPEAGILYFKNPYLAISIRNERAQKKLCSIANWCINRGSWGTYAGTKGLQINIFNYGLPSNNPMFLVGTTIDYEGKLVASHDLNDRSLITHPGGIPEMYFNDLGYPKNMVDEIINKLPGEIKIKQTLETVLGIGKGSKKGLSSKDTILSSLFGLASKNIQGDISQSDWISIVDVVTEILNKEGVISSKEILVFFVENGIPSLPVLGIFNDIVKPFADKEQMNEIYIATQEIFDQIERLRQTLISQGSENAQTIQKAEKMLKDKDLILNSVKEMIGS